ncbi:MAG: hypothetical protein K0R27_1467 [Xanthobacteraceae bacterium]|nr:hypothetical protein [Xanthobacteraceae bacterium]
MSTVKTAADLERATEARLSHIRSAWQSFADAAAGIEPLKSAAEALMNLCAAISTGGAHIERSVYDDISRVSREAMFRVVEAAGDDLCSDRIALSMGTAVNVFWLACGKSEEVEHIEPDEAVVLAEALGWIQNALLELHYRRRLQVSGDKLHRRVLGNLAFSHAVPGEHLH